VIVTPPALTPVTSPAEVTVARAVLLLVHVPPGVMSLSVSDKPTHKVEDKPVIGAGITPSLPKLVPPLPVVMPVTPDVLAAKILPVAAEVVSGCTRRPVIVITSCAPVVLTEIFNVKAVGVIVLPAVIGAIAVISAPGAKVTTGKGAVQNCHPEGGLSVITSVPRPAKSELAVSVMVMVPSAVHEGAAPLTAVWLQTSVSLAGETTTCARPGKLIHDRVKAKRKILTGIKRALSPVKKFVKKCK